MSHPSPHPRLAGKGRALSALGLALGLLGLGGLSACAPAAPRDRLVEFRAPLASLPEDWREEPVLVLSDSVDIRFVTGETGNRLHHRQATWLYVNRRNPNLLEEMVVADHQAIEAPPTVRVTAHFPGGETWSSTSLALRRVRWAGPELHSSDRFLTSIRLPKYPEGTVIRLEVVRTYQRPEFLRSEVLRGEYPALAKTLTLTLPRGADIAVGLRNPEGISLDTARRQDEEARVLTVKAAHLPKLEARTMPSNPETWFAAVHLSLPARGKRSLTWTELGDAYLAVIRNAFASTPELDQVAAGLPKGHPDTVLHRAYTLLRGRIRYHADLGLMHTFVPRKAGEVLAKGYGDCKEMSTLLTQILRSRGAEKVGVALVSTPGSLQSLVDFPSLGGFNHMVVWAEGPDGALRFYDPTVKHGDPADSYFDLVDRAALVIREGRSALVTVPMGPGFRNRVETRSAIAKSAGGWILKGSVRLEGHCAFSLLPTLNAAVGEEKAPLLKTVLKELFAVDASAARLVSATDRSIEVAYEASFNSNFLSMDKGGLLMAWPSLYGGDVRYSSIDVEGPRLVRKFEQSDTWEVPPGFEDLEKQDLEHAIGRGSWTREGGSLRRTFAAGPARVPVEGRQDMQDYVKLKNRFQKATLWQR